MQNMKKAGFKKPAKRWIGATFLKDSRPQKERTAKKKGRIALHRFRSGKHGDSCALVQDTPRAVFAEIPPSAPFPLAEDSNSFGSLVLSY